MLSIKKLLMGLMTSILILIIWRLQLGRMINHFFIELLSKDHRRRKKIHIMSMQGRNRFLLEKIRQLVPISSYNNSEISMNYRNKKTTQSLNKTFSSNFTNKKL